jgi:hypothetical protein
MNSRTTPTNLAIAVILAFGALAYATPASAAEAETTATARYQQERAACMNGSSNQARATCLREAGAALAETRKGQAAGTAADYERNAAARCERLPDADRKDCLARMKGAGTTSGSVSGGGIYRELVTREVGTPVVVAPARP